MSLQQDGQFFLTTEAELAKHHLSRREMECPCCGVIKIGMPTVTIWEAVRAIVGAHWVDCGYRCAAHQNSLVGRYPASTMGALAPHPLAMAMDPTLPNGYSYASFAGVIEQAAHKLGLPVRIGWETYRDLGSGIVHFDTVPLLRPFRPDVAAHDDYVDGARW